jgi:hypothetical protein
VPAASGHARTLAWLGIVLGGSAIILSILREECGFSFPFTGSVAGLLSLALVVFWLGRAGSPDRAMGGPPGGPPDGRGQGPPPQRRDGPPPNREGPPRDRGQDRPPAPASR